MAHIRDDLAGDRADLVGAVTEYETALSINDLTVDKYRIVARCWIVNKMNCWQSTIPDAEIDLLNAQVEAGRIATPQDRVGDNWVRLARVVPVVAAKAGRRRRG